MKSNIDKQRELNATLDALAIALGWQGFSDVKRAVKCGAVKLPAKPAKWVSMPSRKRTQEQAK